MAEQLRTTVHKIIQEMDSNLVTAELANKNVAASICKITKEVLSESLKLEKSKIDTLGESIGSLILMGASVFMDEEGKQIIMNFTRENSQNKAIQIRDLICKWNLAITKLDSYHIENLFKVIKINKTMGFRNVLNFILQN